VIKGCSNEGKSVKITGAVPAWLVSALTHAVHPCKVSVYVPQIVVFHYFNLVLVIHAQLHIQEVKN